MRYALISDIHSNLDALSAVLDFLATQRIDHYLCLGDTVGYGAEPEACLARLQGLPMTGVGGNHDWACVGKCEIRDFNEAARAGVLWTRDRLSFGDMDFLRRLPLVATEGPVTMVHGTLDHPERFHYLVDLAQAVDTAVLCRTTFCALGHTHSPIVCEYDRRGKRIARVLTKFHELAAVPLLEDPTSMCYLMNPGSVGQPRDGDPRASCAILDPDAHLASFHRVPYDIASAQRKIRAARLPEFLADRLAAGR